jgi:UDP-N-acetylmuramate dehydrogenase
MLIPLSEARGEALAELSRIRGLAVKPDAPLADFNRFGIGGPAAALVSTADPSALAEAVDACRRLEQPFYFLGEGSNVICADEGYNGVVLRYLSSAIRREGDIVTAEAGASLQALVDFTIKTGLAGLHTLTRIPGSVGGAVYGNAGAYGHSIEESIVQVRYFDGAGIRMLDRAGCQFEYRESLFKRQKDWLILDCGLAMPGGDPAAMRREAQQIREIRDAKFPPSMRCAGSIFKNLRFSELPPGAQAAVPPEAVRGGKVASAFFLERVGAKGMRQGGIEIASYHANIIYNAGGGIAADLRDLISVLKRRVREEFGFALEEEVQYLGGQPSVSA